MTDVKVGVSVGDGETTCAEQIRQVRRAPLGVDAGTQVIWRAAPARARQPGDA